MTFEPQSTASFMDTPVASPRIHRSAGFSMVEVIIAIVVLAVGVLGMAGTTAYIVRQITLADVMTERSVALQTVIERVQSIPFASVGSGSDSVGVFAVSWSTVAESSTSRLVTVVTTGPGLTTSPGNAFPFLGPNVADTFEYRVISR
ncbi:MAG TPA: prepilin-type N-terminal cleavage/methylation domain-containing protein [Longimicrobiales bacterium]|nr:prepilin-type N-terminal cleavage/methylation domain-containing protein [Longimicrobiales bacterium]